MEELLKYKLRLPLQEIVSYLHVTPVTVSKIRKELLG